MPIFDYRCSDCGNTYDVYHKVREVVEDVICPSCGSGSHKRLMSAPAISLSGKANSDPSPSSMCDSGGGCCGGSCGLN